MIQSGQCGPPHRVLRGSVRTGWTAALLAALCASAAGAESGAPDAPDGTVEPPAGVEVLRVRGRGLAAVSTEVPASVTQFDLKELAALGAQDVSDLARVTPNLEIKTLSATTPTFFIRGVGLNDFNANAAGAVAIFADGVPLNAPALQLGQLFDVENVEVLRGPQGFGDERNASGGAIETVYRKPTGNFEASLRGDYGRYDFRDLEGALGFPVVDELLAGRLAFRWTERDPFYDNRGGNTNDTPGLTPVVCNETVTGRRRDPVPSGLPEEVNDQRSWAARGLLRLTPRGGDSDWLLNLHGGEIDQDSTLGQVLGTGNPSGVTRTDYIDPKVQKIYERNRARILEKLPPGPQRGATATRLAREATLDQVTRDIGRADPFDNDYDLVGEERQQTLGGSLSGEFPLGPLRIRSITGAEGCDRTRDSDFDFSSNPSTHISRDDDAWQLTQNLGFAWEHPSVPLELRWGGYYLREDLHSDSRFALRNPGIRNFAQSYDQDLDSLGAFANFEWDFIDDFTLEGGVRFNWEQKDFELQVRNLGADRTPSPSHERESWSAPTGGVALTWFLSHDVSAYWKYTRGWKAGHFNAGVLELQQEGDVLVTATPSVADPESIDSFEVGLRGSWLDGRLRLGGAFFYYRYHDYQVFVIENQLGSPPQLEIINANDARVYGAEADFHIEPLSGWAPRWIDALSVSGRFGWIESEFLDFSDVRVGAIPTAETTELILSSVVVDFTGNRLPNTPRFKVSGTVEWPLEMGKYGTLIPRYDVSWTDDVFFDPTEGRGVNAFFGTELLPRYAIGQKDFWIHDVRLGYRTPNTRVEVALWVRNLTDTVYKTFVADTTVAFNSLQNLIGEPRTYGVSVSFLFD